jgi:hypothetical protein
MKVLKDLIEKADDTLDEIEWYAEKAHHFRSMNEFKNLADTYIKVAEMHVTIYGMLHERMVALINEEKLVKEFAEAKYLVEEYKKTY